MVYSPRPNKHSHFYRFLCHQISFNLLSTLVLTKLRMLIRSKICLYLSSIHLVVRLISTLLMLEISTLLKLEISTLLKLENSCLLLFSEGLKFQALEGLKSNAKPDESNFCLKLFCSSFTDPR